MAAPRPVRKVALVGYTMTRDQAPWGQPGWELWICNDLYLAVPDNWHRLYDLHDLATMREKPEHDAFLRGGTGKQHRTGTPVTLNGRPVFTWEPQPEWPTSVAFPKEAINAAFGRYFTNSISWMIAHAIGEMVEGANVWAEAQVKEALNENPGLELLAPALHQSLVRETLAQCELHVYGVDMAQGTEYAAQRPSCEYFLGWAAGLGIRIFIPPASDLLKNIAMYGAEDDTPFRAKIELREKELLARGQELQRNVEQATAQMQQLQGALEDVRYWKGVWLNPHVKRDGAAPTAEEAEAAAAGPAPTP